jgi:hypothetical protein
MFKKKRIFCRPIAGHNILSGKIRSPKSGKPAKTGKYLTLRNSVKGQQTKVSGCPSKDSPDLLNYFLSPF